MKPKILVFTTAYHPFIGGAEIAIQEIARRLKNRFDFYIITARLRRDLPKREERPEGTVVRLGFGHPLDKWLFPFLSVQHRELNILWGVDIGMGSLTAAILKAFRPKTPFIFNIQYGYGEERLKKGRFGLIGLVFRFILSQADYVTAISTYLLNLARKYGYDGPGEVIPNGVAVKKFQTPDSKFKIKNSKTIITTSRLVPKNGIDTLISSIAEVRKDIPEVQCWILGDGPERKKLELQAVSHKLEANIKFFGDIPYDDIPQYLHQADVFVRPSRSEGMGNSFVEALAAGLPIIGTPVGGIVDIIENGKTGIFAKVDDPKDLAEKIKTLLKNELLSASIAENGRKMVEERFSWDKIANQYERVFLRYLVQDKYEAKSRRLNIVIATPLYPPQLGGPALYAKHLCEEFRKLRHKVEVFSFGKFLRYPTAIRHFFYFLALMRHILKCDIVLSLDYISVGLPAAIASKIAEKPFMIRVEGDFLWERFVERTRRDITLQEFYLHPPRLSVKERVIKKVSSWVMQSASRLIFSSEWRRKMVIKAYNIPRKKTAIVHNVWVAAQNTPLLKHGSGLRVILWAGRMLYLKNLHRLISAFQKVNDGSWKLYLIGDGPEKENLKLKVESLDLQDSVNFFEPMPHEELLKQLQNSEIFVLPSLSEVGPNVISDAASTGTPFLMTRETGYVEYVGDAVILINPLDEGDIAEKLKFLMNNGNRKKQKEMLRKLNFLLLEGKFPRGWKEAAEEWIYIFRNQLLENKRN